MLVSKDKRPWIKVTHEFYSHPKTMQLSDAAFRALVGLWCHTGQYKTDGFLTKNELKNFAKPRVVRELESVGFLVKNESISEWYLHDWHDHQTEAEDIEKKSVARVKSGSLGGTQSAHKRWHVSRGIKSPDCRICNE